MSGVGAAMAVYGACDAIVSMQKQVVCTINWFSGNGIEIYTFLGSYELYKHYFLVFLRSSNLVLVS